MNDALLPLSWTLPCGTRLTLRAVSPADGPALAAMLGSLSDRSRRWRFHGAVKPTSPAWMARLTEPASPCQQALLVLTDDGLVVAEARWARAAADLVAAEFAIVVADDWQHRGIGQRLMHRLAQGAQAAGVRWLLGEVMTDNAPMCRLMQGLRFQRRDADVDEPEVQLLRFELQVSQVLRPPTPWWQRLLHALRPHHVLPAA